MSFSAWLQRIYDIGFQLLHTSLVGNIKTCLIFVLSYRNDIELWGFISLQLFYQSNFSLLEFTYLLFITDNAIFKEELAILSPFVAQILNGCEILLLNSRRLREKPVIDFQFFVSSFQNLENIHSLVTIQISYIFAINEKMKLK